MPIQENSPFLSRPSFPAHVCKVLYSYFSLLSSHNCNIFLQVQLRAKTFSSILNVYIFQYNLGMRFHQSLICLMINLFAFYRLLSSNTNYFTLSDLEIFKIIPLLSFSTIVCCGSWRSPNVRYMQALNSYTFWRKIHKCLCQCAGMLQLTLERRLLTICLYFTQSCH